MVPAFGSVCRPRTTPGTPSATRTLARFQPSAPRRLKSGPTLHSDVTIQQDCELRARLIAKIATKCSDDKIYGIGERDGDMLKSLIVIAARTTRPHHKTQMVSRSPRTIRLPTLSTVRPVCPRAWEARFLLVAQFLQPIKTIATD
jgi:hypothetical protein